ncbi:hypothetical protein BGX26_004916 [Mortierella sp. AD094]|nr:hypothetical protein BGX26_004916 [Mortierella sp. AD094]
MDLPELRTQVAEYLHKPHLAVASVVCKSWNDSFIPFLYSEITWSFDINSPSGDILLKYAGHVRKLHIHNMELSTFPVEVFTRLDLLYVRGFTDAPETWRQLAKLFHQNQRLIDVSVSARTTKSMIPAELSKDILSPPNLKKLAFTYGDLDQKSTELFLDTCLHLEELVLYATKIAHFDSFERWGQFSEMRSLSFLFQDDLTSQQQLQWIKKCPQLRSLIWYSDDEETFSISEFCKTLSDFCMLIDDIRLIGWTLSDENISRIIDSSARLNSISIPESGFGSRALNSCSRYFPTLTNLDVQNCESFTSTMSQRILTSCPQLTEFAGTILDARDILGFTDEPHLSKEEETDTDTSTGKTAASTTSHPQNWVCLSLQSLSIFICGLDDKPPEWQQNILQQLAMLGKLESLSIGSNFLGVRGCTGGLDLRLDAGLNALKSLERLESFDFVGLIPDMEERDLLWMLSAWPRLKSIGGQLHSLKSRQDELERILIAKFIEFFYG